MNFDQSAIEQWTVPAGPSTAALSMSGPFDDVG
jgi:hypothetical protein